jgi:hypothetical protein
MEMELAMPVILNLANDDERIFYQFTMQFQAVQFLLIKRWCMARLHRLLGETSKCWIASNLGSGHHAGYVNDDKEPSADWYSQFNRKQGYMHDGETRTPPAWINGSISYSTFCGQLSGFLLL